MNRHDLPFLSQQLVEAWTEEHGAIQDPDGVPGPETRNALAHALLSGQSMEVLRLAADDLEQIESGALPFLQTEAERQACLNLWPDTDPELHAEDEESTPHEVVLLGVACSGSIRDLAAWLERPEHTRKLEALIRLHLTHMLGIPAHQLRQMALSPLVASVAVAGLTADDRRRLMHEMVSTAPQPSSTVLSFLTETEVTMENDLPMGDALLLVAAILETDWTKDEPRASEALADLAFAQVDEDVADQMGLRWIAGIHQLKRFPEMAVLAPPQSINASLLCTLHARLTNSRLGTDPSTMHPRTPDGEPKFEADPIVHLNTFYDQKGHWVSEARTSTETLPTVRIPMEWAMIEGEISLQETVANAYGLPMGVLVFNGGDGKADEETNETLQAAPEPRDIQGNHPAWARALPAPARLQ